MAAEEGKQGPQRCRQQPTAPKVRPIDHLSLWQQQACDGVCRQHGLLLGVKAIQ